MGPPDLPPYADMMAAYHEAFRDELRDAVAAAGAGPGDVVVDVACGDGSYSRWLAERVGPAGRVVAVDLCPSFLDLARRGVVAAGLADRVRFVRMDARHSAIADAAADLAWCAQSLYSLPDPVLAARGLSRLVRDGGRIAVFESDGLHHLSMPWPADVELALRAAELAAFQARSDRPSKFYVARDLPRVFREAGLPRCDVLATASSRRAPFDAPTRRFLTAYLANLLDRSSPFLSPEIRSRVEALVDPDAPASLLNDPDSLLVRVDLLATSPVARA